MGIGGMVTMIPEESREKVEEAIRALEGEGWMVEDYQVGSDRQELCLDLRVFR